MTSIPFVGRGQFSGSSSPYLRSGFNVLSNARSTNLDGSTQRIRSSGSESAKDAVEKNFSEEPKSIEELQNKDDRGIRIGRRDSYVIRLARVTRIDQ